MHDFSTCQADFYKHQQLVSDSSNYISRLECTGSPAVQVDELDTARNILRIILDGRRLLDSAGGDSSFEREAEPHIGKVLRAVSQRQPINMILPGFPAKSPNRSKTLGPMPDLAEKNALQILHDLCERIGAVYEPGAKITICSDGRVFADLVCIPEQDVTAYGEYLREFSRNQFARTFDFFNLDDAFSKISSFDILREELLICYGEPILRLRQRCMEEAEAKAMYLGITKFIFEDYSGIEPFRHQSRTSIQKMARLIAYRVIQRSNAWSRMLEDHFSDAIRLSIHPQFRVSSKIGVYLGETNGDCWLTPWHSVAVRHNGKITLCKRVDAEKHSMLAFREGRPSHFEMVEALAEVVG